jgi:hypothetical protein
MSAAGPVISSVKNCVQAYRCWIFSWAMSHICANDEHRSQVSAQTDRKTLSLEYLDVK